VPRRSGGSLAQKILGADFDLDAADCPLGPGEWKDRIQGIPVTCVGSGDWFRAADGYVGVTKADACYATWDSDADPYLVAMQYTAERTLIITARDYIHVDGLRMALISYRAAANNNYAIGFTGRYATGSLPRGIYTRAADNDITAATYAKPTVAGSMDPAVLAMALYRIPEENSLYKSVFARAATNIWSAYAGNVASAYHSAALDQRRLLSREYVSSSWLANASARDLAISHIVSVPGRPDPAAMMTWAQAIGIPWT